MPVHRQGEVGAATFSLRFVGKRLFDMGENTLPLGLGSSIVIGEDCPHAQATTHCIPATARSAIPFRQVKGFSSIWTAPIRSRTHDGQTARRGLAHSSWRRSEYEASSLLSPETSCKRVSSISTSSRRTLARSLDRPDYRARRPRVALSPHTRSVAFI